MNALLVLGISVLAAAITARGVGALCVALAGRLEHGFAGRSTISWCALALAPAVSALAVAVSVAAPPALFGGCHCLSHGHHGHLCYEHMGLGWVVAFGWVLSSGWLGRTAMQLSTLGMQHLAASRWLRESSAVGETRVCTELGVVHLLDGASSVAGTLGIIHPRIVVSHALWAALPVAARRAVVAHEAAHVARRDPLMLMLISAAVSVLSAHQRQVLLGGWRRTTELRCDRAAAATEGPLAVAEALVACGRARAGVHAELPTVALAAAKDDLEIRVEELLSIPAAMSTRPSRGDLLALPLLCLATLALTATAGEHVHHFVETILNSL